MNSEIINTESVNERAVATARRGTWPTGLAADQVTLPFDLRYRRRIRLPTDGGGAVLLDLDHATALADGDGLRLQDGSWIAVHAAPEALLEIRGRDAHHLTRLAWHIGNRHVPCEVQGDRLLIEPDRVIAEMLVGLGAVVTEIEAPFQPEGGAYDARHSRHHEAEADHDDGH